MAIILVVDDTPSIRDIITIFLELEGFDVIIANDGEEGIEQVRCSKPDVVITDINMPRLNGIDMIRRIRSLPDCNDVPIIVTTGYGSEEAEEALTAGANRVMTHPVEQQALVFFVSDLLRRRKRFTAVE